MKKLVIIRTCKRDDFLAWLCYKSFKDVGVEADYLFFAEWAAIPYQWITKVSEKIVYRSYAGNFGGIMHAIPYIADLRFLEIDAYDRIIICDSDIVLHKDPFELEYEFAGIRDDNNKRHFSGQFQIYSNRILKGIIEYNAYHTLSLKLMSEGINIADDTLVSYVATEMTDNTVNFIGKQYWSHEKLYNLEKDFV